MKNKKGSIMILLILLISLSVLVVGCGGNEQTSSSEEKVFKLGVQVPLTGPNSRIGTEMKEAISYAFDEIGYKIGDYKVELIWINCETDPEKASRAFEEAALKDNIQACLLNWNSSVAVALMELAAKNKIPYFFGMGSTNVINERIASDPEKYSYYIGKGWPIASKLTVGYVQVLNEAIANGTFAPRNKKVAFAGDDTDYGRSFVEDTAKVFEDNGWEVVKPPVLFSAGETDFYPVMTKLKAQDASVVSISSSNAPMVTAFIKQAKEVGLNSLIIADGLGWTGEWYSLVGDASNGVLDMIPQWTTEKSKQFAKDFEDRTGIIPSANAAGLSYDWARFFIQICNETLKESGTIDREALYNYAWKSIKAGTFSFKDGILMKEYKFTEESLPDVVIGPDHYIFPVLQYFDGEAKIIWPSDWKQSDFVSPDKIN
jgi:branched-chain amino acid transport system substrate-binding protein